MKICIGNLSPKVTARDLCKLFGAYGLVESTEMVRDDDTGNTLWFGIVLMPSRPEATEAITALQGRYLKGHKLELKEAPPRAPQQPRRGRYRKDDRTGHG